jgi:hypothetical protein
MQVRLTVNFFSANNNCTISIVPDDYQDIFLTSDDVYEYDNLKEQAYQFGFSGQNPEGGSVRIRLEVNDVLKYDKTITKTGFYAKTTLVEPN